MAKLYALLVGINEYHPQTSVRNLKGCVNDVNAMDAFLKKHYAHLKPAILQVLNEKATREQLLKTFDRHLSQAGEGDIALFYYSGHGSFENTSPEFETYDSQNQNETLVCHDSRLPGHQDLADKELGVLISRLHPGAQKVLILDSCHSGSITRNTEEDMSRQEPARSGESGIYKRPLNSYLLKGDNFYIEQKAEGKVKVPATPHILMSACSRNQKALEKIMDNSDQRRGLFSTHLLDVIEKNNGQISYNELYTQIRVSVIKDRKEQTPRIDPLFGFNANLGFLADHTINPNRYAVVWDRGLKLKLGQVHGLLPTEADDIAHIQIKLFPKNDKKQPGLDAEILSIGIEESSLLAPGASQAETYEAEIVGLPKSMAILIGLVGPKGKKKELLTLNKTVKSPYFQLVDVEEGMDYALEIKDEVLRLFHVPSNLIVQGFKSNDLSLCFEKIVPFIEHVEKWERYKRLEQRAKTLKEAKIEIKLELEQENGEMHAIPSDMTAVTVDVNKASNGEDWESVPFLLSIDNKGRDDLFVMLLGMSRSYNVSVYHSEWINGQSGKVELLENTFTLTTGLSKEIDVLKVIVSTTEINPASFTLEELVLGEIQEVKRSDGEEKGIGGGGKEVNAAKKDDWFTKTFIITVSGNEKEVGKQESKINGLTFQKNDTLKAKLSFGSIYAHTRSTDPINRLPELLADSDLEIMDFAQTRGGGDKCIIELNDIQGEDQLMSQPLQIELEDKMQPGEMMIPVTFDGEFILPFGEVKETPDGRPMISIDHLPAQVDDGRRSVGRALKFVLLKTVFKDRFDVFKLRWVDYSVSKNRRKTTNLKDKVAAANKILLLVHGIIGDTKFMADQAEFAVKEKAFDLVLTYDFENLDTDIDVIADKLHQDLVDVGLGTGHKKELHIVAHSMGGLVSRHMIENIRQDDGSVQKLLMFGTPNGGSRFGLVPGLIDQYLPEKYKELVRDKAKAWYKLALGLALNLLPGYVKVILEYVIKLAKLDEIESPQILNTLMMMSPDSDFIKGLAENEIPQHTTYFVVAGDISNYQSSGGWFTRLVEKIELGVGRVVYFDLPNDIAVGTADIKKIKGLDIENNATIVPGHHLNYFENPPSMEKWKEWV
ncbi:MAG: caspase family protein [Saprospiraceae bacterium]